MGAQKMRQCERQPASSCYSFCPYQQDAAVQRNAFHNGNGDILECVGMLNADRGVDTAVVAGVGCAWKRFRK